MHTHDTLIPSIIFVGLFIFLLDDLETHFQRWNKITWTIMLIVWIILGQAIGIWKFIADIFTL